MRTFVTYTALCAAALFYAFSPFLFIAAIAGPKQAVCVLLANRLCTIEDRP